MVHPITIPPNFSCKRLFLNLAHFKEQPKEGINSHWEAASEIVYRVRPVELQGRGLCWAGSLSRRFWAQHLNVLRDCWKCLPHCVLSVLLIFLGHHLCLCLESLKHFILLFSGIKVEIHVHSLKWVIVYLCVYVYQGPGFSLSFSFTILSSGLCPCKLQNDFWNSSHHVQVQNGGKSSIPVISPLSGKQKLTQKLITDLSLGSLARTW